MSMHVLLQDNTGYFMQKIDPKWDDRLLMKQHGGNLGKCACAGSALWDAVLRDSCILGLSSSTRPDDLDIMLTVQCRS
jgi:hypothetical protein